MYNLLIDNVLELICSRNLFSQSMLRVLCQSNKGVKKNQNLRTFPKWSLINISMILVFGSCVIWLKWQGLWAFHSLMGLCRVLFLPDYLVWTDSFNLYSSRTAVFAVNFFLYRSLYSSPSFFHTFDKYHTVFQIFLY